MNDRTEEMARNELRALVDRAGPTIGEFFDSYVVLGVRAGSIDLGMHVAVAPTELHRIAMDNLILTLATNIVQQRSGGG